MLERDVKQLRAENEQLTEDVKKQKMNQSTMIIHHLEAIKQQRSSKHDYYQDDCYNGYNQDDYCQDNYSQMQYYGQDDCSWIGEREEYKHQDYETENNSLGSY